MGMGGFSAAENALKPITRKTFTERVGLENHGLCVTVAAAHTELCCVLLALDERTAGGCA